MSPNSVVEDFNVLKDVLRAATIEVSEFAVPSVGLTFRGAERGYFHHAERDDYSQNRTLPKWALKGEAIHAVLNDARPRSPQHENPL